jgi:molybdenum cofactor cytidylyltransferase
MDHLAAVILAAGMSRRMGRPKMTLPWGDNTVIGQVVRVLHQAGVGEIVVVTGGERMEVEKCLAGLPARAVYNPRYELDQMVLSLQVGLAALGPSIQAALVALGDQPQIQPEVTRLVMDGYAETRAALVIPSYQMHRGHPWLIDRSLWPEIMALEGTQTMRDVINSHALQIRYLEVQTDTILRDLDTPQDYQRESPQP